MKKYEPNAPDATKRSRGQKTGTPLMRRLMLMLALVILSSLAQTIHIAAQERQAPDRRPQKQMTEQQARDRTFALLQTEMKKTGKLNDGWQEAYKTSKGVIYAHVQRGKVTNIAVDSAKTGSKVQLEALKAHGPRGYGDRVDTGGTVVLQPNTEPSDEQISKCKKKLVGCMTRGGGLFGLLSVGVAIVSGDLGAIIVAVIDEQSKKPNLNECVGEGCRKILGIE